MNTIPLTAIGSLVKTASTALREPESVESLFGFYEASARVWGQPLIECAHRTMHLGEFPPDHKNAKPYEVAAILVFTILMLNNDTNKQDEDPITFDDAKRTFMLFVEKVWADTGLHGREFFTLVDEKFVKELSDNVLNQPAPVYQ